MGGHVEDKPGVLLCPNLLSNVTQDMPAFDDELFGPVVSLIHAKDEHEAITCKPIVLWFGWRYIYEKYKTS